MLFGVVTPATISHPFHLEKGGDRRNGPRKGGGGHLTSTTEGERGSEERPSHMWLVEQVYA